jgi:hypothetical protein
MPPGSSNKGSLGSNNLTSSSTSGGSTLLHRLGSLSLAGLSDVKQLAAGTTPYNGRAGGSSVAAPISRCVDRAADRLHMLVARALQVAHAAKCCRTNLCRE